MAKINRDKLTVGNWKETVDEAVSRFPQDIRDSVGIRYVDCDSIIITVAVEAVDDGHEASICEILIRYWKAVRETDRPRNDDPSVRMLYEPGGSQFHTLDWPVIEIISYSMTNGIFPDRANKSSLINEIWDRCLIEMYHGGLIGKDEGRSVYYREDGSKIEMIDCHA